MHSLFVIWLLVYGVTCESHHLRIYITTTSAPISWLPTYSIVSYLDDLMIGRYNSDIRQVESLYTRTKGNILTKLAQHYENYHKFLTEFVLKMFNHTLVPPKVKVSDLQSDKITKLHCFVYGFYPQAVDVKWMRNDIDDVYSEEAKQVFPNPDGTFQIRVTVEVTPMYGESYSCHVDHSSLNDTMIISWEPKRNNSTIYIVIGVVLVTLVFAVVGIIIKKKIPYIQHQTVNTREPEPESS